MFNQEVSLGELVDRIAILRVKSQRSPTPAFRYAVLERLAPLVRKFFNSGSTPHAAIRPYAKQLCEIHGRLWDAENTIRAVADQFAPAGDGQIEVDSWLIEAQDGPHMPSYERLKKYLVTSQLIRRLNSERHSLVRQVDALVHETPEPKFYGDVNANPSSRATAG